MTPDQENRLFQLYKQELSQIYTQEPSSTAFERAKEQYETFETELAKLNKNAKDKLD